MLTGNPQCKIDLPCGGETVWHDLTFIFDPVWFNYPFKIFDNTAATYGTDYALGLFMVYGAYTTWRDAAPSPLRSRVMGLLLLYAGSVFSGGVAHMLVLTPAMTTTTGGDPLSFASAQELNTPFFRLLWCICVGTVCAAGGCLGAIACQMGRAFPAAAASQDGDPTPNPLTPPPPGAALPALPAAAPSKASSKGPASPRAGGQRPVRGRTASLSCGAVAGGVGGAMLGGIALGALGAVPGTALWELGRWAGTRGEASASLVGAIVGSVAGMGAGAPLGALAGALQPRSTVCLLAGVCADGNAAGTRGGAGAPARGSARRLSSWSSSKSLLPSGGVSEALWVLWAIALVSLTCAGGLSMLRPAADIFVAGFTQAFPTLHVFGVWWANGDCDRAPRHLLGVQDGSEQRKRAAPLVTRAGRAAVALGILLNVPLIVAYPLVLLHLPHLRLGLVNAALHLWLSCAWGLQWWGLKHLCTAYAPLYDRDRDRAPQKQKAP